MLNKKFLGLLVMSALIAVGCGENRAGQLRPVTIPPAEPEAVKIDESTIVLAKGDSVDLTLTGDLSAAVNESGKIVSIVSAGKIVPVPTVATTDEKKDEKKEEPGSADAGKDAKAEGEKAAKAAVTCQIEKTANAELDMELKKDGKQGAVSLSVDSVSDAKSADQITVMNDKAGNIVITCVRKADNSAISIAELNATFDGRGTFAKSEAKEEEKK